MYLPLHRKYRPLTFNDLVGQEVMSKIVKQEIVTNKVPNSYIFCGSRGSGKTSSARILSRALNCLNPIEGEPCNVCNNCQLILSDKFPDVIEMDAGSHSGVNDARQLIEDCKSGAKYGKYKVYIVDESHGLSKSAWNALLKLIEEPSSSIKFIFCTTEIAKIPETIVSRNQVFNFERISTSNVIDRLSKISELEGLDIEDRIIEEIAKKADGSLRDSLVLLDQISFIKNDQSLLNKVLYTLSNEDIIEFLHNIEVGNVKELFGMFTKLEVSEEIFIDEVLHYICNSFIDKNEVFVKYGKDKLYILIDKLAEWKRELSKTINRQVTNEFNILKLIKVLDNNNIITDKETILSHTIKLASKLGGNFEKINDDSYLVISKRGIHLTVVTNTIEPPKGYYCVFPEDTKQFIDTDKTPIELIKEGIIKRR